jgi:hypothetical protein
MGWDFGEAVIWKIFRYRYWLLHFFWVEKCLLERTMWRIAKRLMFSFQRKVFIKIFIKFVALKVKQTTVWIK